MEKISFEDIRIGDNVLIISRGANLWKSWTVKVTSKPYLDSFTGRHGTDIDDIVFAYHKHFMGSGLEGVYLLDRTKDKLQTELGTVAILTEDYFGRYDIYPKGSLIVYNDDDDPESESWKIISRKTTVEGWFDEKDLSKIKYKIIDI